MQGGIGVNMLLRFQLNKYKYSIGVYSFRHSRLYLRDYCRGNLYLLTYRSIPPGMTGNDEGRRYHSGLTCL